MPRSLLDWAFEGRSAKWLYVVGTVLLIVFMKYGTIPMSLLLASVADSSRWPMPVAYVYDRLPLVGLIAAAPLWVHFVQKRPWWSVVSARPQIEWWNLGVGALFALLALIVLAVVDTTIFGMTITFGTPNMATYWPALIFGIFFVFMQIASEELIFRGYGMQAVRRFTASRVAMVVITAILFSIPHYDNLVFAGRPWWALLSYVVPAILFGWMVLRTGSLWMPIGWHWLNNFILTRVYIVEGDVTSGRDAFAHAFGSPPEEVSLVSEAVLYLIIAVIINYLVSRREAAQAGEEAEPAN